MARATAHLGDDEVQMSMCFTAHYSAIAAYFTRRCANLSDAEDAATEVFSIAWRRLDKLPPEPETRLWLFGVARRVLSTQRRSATRRRRLTDRLGTTHAPPRDSPDLCTDTVTALTLRGILRELPETDREVLLLSAWDGLSPAEIATVLDKPANVVSARLYRARQRLTAELAASDIAVPNGKEAANV